MSGLNPKFVFSRIEGRLRRTRPGSVLILVIVLLLLLAILGAAFISTTRSDRVAEAQNLLNAQVDAEAAGIGSAVSGVIADHLNDDFGDLRGNASGNVNATGTQLVPLGQNLVFRGAYNNTTSYQPGDVVANSATWPNTSVTPPQFFVCVTAITGTTPDLTKTTPWKQTTHLPVTSSFIQPWLAERAPSSDGGIILSGAGLQPPQWGNISQAPVPATTGGGNFSPVSMVGNLPFESPDGTPVSATAPAIPTLTPGQSLNVGQGASLTLFPSFRYSAYYSAASGGKQATNVLVPAMSSGTPPVYKPPTPGTANNTFVAGDADGDGIADSLMFRLPGVSYDGLTWYAAVRVIDNNSAINANTAWSRDYEFAYKVPTAGGTLSLVTPTPPGARNNYYALFQTSVGLYELLRPNDLTITSPATVSPFDQFINYRFGENGANLATQTLTLTNDLAYPDSSVYLPPPIPATIPPQPKRGDMTYVTASDAYYHNLIRRTSNPGNPGILGTAANLLSLCQPLPLSDQAALAYKFCLVNPQTVVSGAPSSVLETLLKNSLVADYSVNPPNPYRSTPFSGAPASGTALADDQSQWYPYYFGYPLGPTEYLTGSQLRPLLVTHNPVSNAIWPVMDPNVAGEPLQNPNVTPASAMLPYGVGDGSVTGTKNYSYFKGPWNSKTPAYYFNDVVVGGDGYTYIWSSATAGNTTNAPQITTTSAGPANIAGTQWQFQPWTKTPVKANVNTATFRELFRAFWSVMAGNPSDCAPTGPIPTSSTQVFNIYTNNIATGLTGGNLFGPFRSPLRDNTTNVGTAKVGLLDAPVTVAGGPEFKNMNAMQLRAALAAVNTLGLRDNSQNVISRTINISNVQPPTVNAAAASLITASINVFSSAPQPVISEVYVNLYSPSAGAAGTNAAGYVAVELYNPYNFDLTLNNWQLALINRTPANNPAYPNLQMLPIGQVGQIGTSVTIHAGSYLLLENFNWKKISPDPDGNSAQYRPLDLNWNGTMPQAGAWAPSGIPAATAAATDIYVPYLETVIQGAAIDPAITSASYTQYKYAQQTTATGGNSPGGELVLLRPRRIDGNFTSLSDPLNTYDEGPQPTTTVPYGPKYWDLVPVDSYDFTGMVEQTIAPFLVFNYVRPSGSGQLFSATYPGQYISPAPIPGYSRQVPTGFVPITAPAATAKDYTYTPSAPTQFGFGGGPSGAYYPTNPFPPVQVYNLGLPPSPLTVPPGHFPNFTVGTAGGSTTALPKPTAYPFGGFVRNGDLLDIPYIGAYTIKQTTLIGGAPVPQYLFLEMNSLPMDCFLASTDYGPATAIGMPHPLNYYENAGRFVPMASAIGSFAMPAGAPDFQAWAARLFDYLTVQGNDSYLPNFDPNLNDTTETGLSPYKYPYTAAAGTGGPNSVNAIDAAALDHTGENQTGVEGLININTANWKVLSMLPMVPPKATFTSGATPQQANQYLAQEIVAYRLQHGPFMSIFELNNVPGFQAAANPAAFSMTTAPFTTPSTPAFPAAGPGPSGTVGMISPPDTNFPNVTLPPAGTTSGVLEDYQWDMNTLNRISNLITTRSDTFTVYIELQGWQNVPAPGTAWTGSPPQPVVTRHFAFIADRSGITADPNTRSVKTTPIPND
jgi:hypothetical protein